MIEITDGIYQLKLPLVNSALGTVNTYLIKGNDGYLMVDTGWNVSNAFESLQTQLTEMGARIEDISRIVITHVHADHYGLAGRLREISGADLAMHRIEKDMVQTRYVDLERLIEELAEWLKKNGVSADDLAQLQRSPAVTARFVVVALPDTILHGGETIPWGDFNFHVLWTPGHSQGHICLYEPDRRIMFSGDYILPNITPHISLNAYQVGTNPLDEYLRSLPATRELPAVLILPGHEDPFNDLPGRIDEIIHHHGLRNSEILGSLATGTKTAYQVATTITWMSDKGGIGWARLAALDRRLAVLETLSHLEYMRHRGQVVSSLRDHTVYYQAA